MRFLNLITAISSFLEIAASQTLEYFLRQLLTLVEIERFHLRNGGICEATAGVNYVSFQSKEEKRLKEKIIFIVNFKNISRFQKQLAMSVLLT